MEYKSRFSGDYDNFQSHNHTQQITYCDLEAEVWESRQAEAERDKLAKKLQREEVDHNETAGNACFDIKRFERSEEDNKFLSKQNAELNADILRLKPERDRYRKALEKIYDLPDKQGLGVTMHTDDGLVLPMLPLNMRYIAQQALKDES